MEGVEAEGAALVVESGGGGEEAGEDAHGGNGAEGLLRDGEWRVFGSKEINLPVNLRFSATRISHFFFFQLIEVRKMRVAGGSGK